MRVDLQDIHKTYRDSHGEPVSALQGVDLQVHAGEFVAISGISGCGKSTLLNVIGCLDRPDRGLCRLDDEDVADWPEHRRAMFRNRHIGFVFQSFHLLPFLTVQQNVELPYLYCDEDSPVCPEAAANSLNSLGLEGVENRYPGELSGGQQQRVAIARALLLGAELLLADEPTGNVDAITAQSILDLFTELTRQGKTVILVTHDPAVAGRAGRQVQMASGKIAQDTAAVLGGVP